MWLSSWGKLEGNALHSWAPREAKRPSVHGVSTAGAGAGARRKSENHRGVKTKQKVKPKRKANADSSDDEPAAGAPPAAPAAE